MIATFSKKNPKKFHYLYISELLVLWPMMGHFFFFFFGNLIDSGQLVHLPFPHDCISIVRSIGTRVISGGHKSQAKVKMHTTSATTITFILRASPPLWELNHAWGRTSLLLSPTLLITHLVFLIPTHWAFFSKVRSPQASSFLPSFLSLCTNIFEEWGNGLFCIWTFVALTLKFMFNKYGAFIRISFSLSLSPL